MSTRRTLLLGVVGAGLIGCGDDDKSDGTPKISYGKENCARCGMLIADERYTAAIVEPNGHELHFDDTGEMAATIQETGIDERTIWVHAYESKNWLLGNLAFYVIDPNRETPMATGVVSFGTLESATTFTGNPKTEVLTWSELLSTWSIE